MGKINSRSKGNRFERVVAGMINYVLGTTFRRVPLSGGLEIKGDLYDADVLQGYKPPEYIHAFCIECKHCEQIRIEQWLDQVERDCHEYKEPLLIFKKNKRDSYACLRFTTFLEMVQRIQEKI